MMPGATKNKEMLSRVNDKDLDRAEAIVRSMTPEERHNPKIINGSRRLRIANGSGVSVGEVSQLITNFFEGQKQMRAMLGGAMPGMGALMGGGGGGRRAARTAAKAKKGKRKSGDPRKAASGGSGGSGRPAGRGQAGTGGRGQAGTGGGAGNGRDADGAGAPAAAASAPTSMEELAEMLRDAQAAAGPAGLGNGEGFTGFRGGPAALPPMPGPTPPGNVPAAFGKRRKKK
jgi:signal recognition particle subunit SRP54